MRPERGDLRGAGDHGTRRALIKPLAVAVLVLKVAKATK